MSDMSVRFLRAQLKKLTSAAEEEPITVERKAQDFLGAVMLKLRPANLLTQESIFEGFRAAMISPAAPEGYGVVMYVHGGGYCCGDYEYARCFGSILASKANARVFCPAYRLAPEYPYPAALRDVMVSYRFLLETFPAEKIVLAGESAGGGLIYAMCLEMKNEGLPLPGGIVGMSPWTDLTSSGASYRENADVDPSMSVFRLHRFATLYTDKPEDPLCSPLFGDLSGLPESLLFVGGDEIMRDDAAVLHQRLLDAGCKSTLTIAPEMWHAYVLYGFKERQADTDTICEFIRSIVK